MRIGPLILENIGHQKWRVKNTLRNECDFITYGLEDDVIERVRACAAGWEKREGVGLYIHDYNPDPLARSRAANAIGGLAGRKLSDRTIRILQSFDVPRTAREVIKLLGEDEARVYTVVQQSIVNGRLRIHENEKPKKYVVTNPARIG